MNLGELRTELLNLVDDDSYEDIANSYINIALGMATEAVSLPTLKSMATVSTGVGLNMLNLGVLTNFGGKVLAIYGPSDITRYANLEALVEAYQRNGVLADDAGDVEAVAQEGDILWYQKVPAAAQTLTVIYYKVPEPLVLDSDIPTDLPTMLHRQLLVYGAAKAIYDSIEDGIEEAKVNSASADIQFSRAVGDLRVWVGNRRVHYNSSAWKV